MGVRWVFGGFRKMLVRSSIVARRVSMDVRWVCYRFSLGARSVFGVYPMCVRWMSGRFPLHYRSILVAFTIDVRQMFVGCLGGLSIEVRWLFCSRSVD